MPADKRKNINFLLCMHIYIYPFNDDDDEKAFSLTFYFFLKIFFRFLLILACVLSDDYLTIDFLFLSFQVKLNLEVDEYILHI